MSGKIHSEWAQNKLDEWRKWNNEGNEPRYDDDIVKQLTSTLYDKKFQEDMMDFWDKKQFLKFRDDMIKHTFETVYYPEAIWYLKNMRSLVSIITEKIVLKDIVFSKNVSQLEGFFQRFSTNAALINELEKNEYETSYVWAFILACHMTLK